MAIYIVLGVFFAFIFAIYIAIIPAEFATLAAKKGYSYGTYWFYVFLFGIPAMILVMALPENEDKKPSHPKPYTCPKCHAPITKGAEYCSKCNAKLRWSSNPQTK